MERGYKKAVFGVCINGWGLFKRGTNNGIHHFGVAIGALCALLRFPALVLIPLSGLLALAAVLSGVIIHAHPGFIATEALGPIAASQLMYVSLGLTHHLVRSRNAMLEIRAAIGQGLRAELTVPRRLPPELSALLTQLQFA